MTQAVPSSPAADVNARATAWAVTHTFTRRTLIKAIRSGLTELWQLADYFNVTEHFMKDALTYYELYNGE